MNMVKTSEHCHICNTQFDVTLQQVENDLVMLCDRCFAYLHGYDELTAEWIERYRQMGEQRGHITFDWPAGKTIQVSDLKLEKSPKPPPREPVHDPSVVVDLEYGA